MCYLQDLSKDPVNDGGTDTKSALLESFRAGMTVPPRAHRPSFSQDSTEQIRRRELTRTLKKMHPSPEEQEAIERLSHLLVAKLLLGSISPRSCTTRSGFPKGGKTLIVRPRRTNEEVRSEARMYSC